LAPSVLPIAFRAPRSGVLRNLYASALITNLMAGDPGSANVVVSVFVGTSASATTAPKFVETALRVTLPFADLYSVIGFFNSGSNSGTVSVNAGNYVMLAVYSNDPTNVDGISGLVHAGFEFA